MKLLDLSAAEPLQAVDLSTLALLPDSERDIALTVQPDVKVADVAPYLERLATIVVPFAAFRDGRGFSTAAQLREAGFTGELRARGDLLADQARMLSRCGFDTVELPPAAVAEEWERALTVVTVAYQPAQDDSRPVLHHRIFRELPVTQQTEAVLAAPSVAAPEGAVPGVTILGIDAPGLAATSSATVHALHPPRSPNADELERLNKALRGAPAQEILRVAIKEAFAGSIAVMSSFGTEAAISLHLVAQQDRATPVLFLDTAKHFAPTLTYRDELVERLGLTDVRVLEPTRADIRANDPKGDLWRTNPDLCCDFRKVRPLAEVSGDFRAIITGRKRFHGADRMRLPIFDEVNGQIRVNPLANWSAEQLNGYFIANGLQRHPLMEAGYSSIGCYTCTEPNTGSDVRGGRWAGAEKRECGIHLPSRQSAALQQAS